MGMPEYVAAHIHAEILPTVQYLQCVSMGLVNQLSLEAFVGIDSNDLAFLRVDLHLPHLFLLFKHLVFLQSLCISI